MRSASGVTYLHGDHPSTSLSTSLGSTSVTSGASTSAQTYYPFGAVRTTQGTLPTDYTFTGQKVDASAGLMYYGARYYDAGIGRFVRPDSIIPDQFNPQSLNRYAYVRNNPVRYTDPTGHCEPDECPGRYRRDSSGAAWWDVEREPSLQPPADVDWSLPTQEQAFDLYYAKLCGAMCELTLRIMPSGLKDLGMLIADEGGTFGGIRYRNQLTPEEKAEEMRRMMLLAAGMTAPVRGNPRVGGSGVTVIGSRSDVAKVKQLLPEVNILDVPEEVYSPKTNVKWLYGAVRRGDEIWLVTDPVKWKQVNPESKLFMELRFLEYIKVNPVHLYSR